jgi:hypothetical protein
LEWVSVAVARGKLREKDAKRERRNLRHKAVHGALDDQMQRFAIGPSGDDDDDDAEEEWDLQGTKMTSVSKSESYRPVRARWQDHDDVEEDAESRPDDDDVEEDAESRPDDDDVEEDAESRPMHGASGPDKEDVESDVTAWEREFEREIAKKTL